MTGTRFDTTAAVAFLLCLLSACTPNTADRSLTEISGRTMGTTYAIKMVELPSGIDVAVIRRQIDEILDRVNGRMSTYLDDSELSLFNRSEQTNWFPVSAELVDVLTAAQGVSALTGGAFDVTVAPLVNLWGFGPVTANDLLPSQQSILDNLARVGYRGLQLRAAPPSLKKHRPDMLVDLSAIAKGYAVDRLAEYFDAIGVADYMVEIGGEIKAKGRNAKGRIWRIAVEKPSTAARSVHMVISLNDAGLATSGDYRNYFERDGRRYSHTLDPATGRPVTHRLASVTVVNASVMHADAWATALLVLGPEAGYQLAEAQGIAALLVIRTEDGFANKTTTAFAEYLPSDKVEGLNF